MYDKLEKKEDAPEENPYSDVAAPSNQSLNASEAYTVSDHNEDHVYVNVNGAHMIDHSSSISADVKEGTVRDSGWLCLPVDVHLNLHTAPELCRILYW